jgi:hypothetical protein
MRVLVTHLQYLQRNSLMLETTELVSGITFSTRCFKIQWTLKWNIEDDGIERMPTSLLL